MANTGCAQCSLEQEIQESRTALCEQHTLEALAETARMAESDYQFAVLKKIVELDKKIKEIKK